MVYIFYYYDCMFVVISCYLVFEEGFFSLRKRFGLESDIRMGVGFGNVVCFYNFINVVGFF